MAGDGYRVGVAGRDRPGRDDDPRAARRARVPGRRGRPLRLRALGRQGAASGTARRSPAASSSEDSIQGLDLVLSSAGGAISAEWTPRLVEAGAVVVDNTSYWRMHDDVPLVVAEVNPEALDDHNGIVANPNCSTMQMVVALKPLYDEAGIERLVISTYQAVSGTGKAAIDELTRAVARGPRTASEPPAGDLPAPDRLQRPRPGRQLPRRRRPHRRGAQADQRDPQDPRRRTRSGSAPPASGCRS